MQAGVTGTVLSSSAEDDSSDEKRLGESGCRAGGDRGLGAAGPGRAWGTASLRPARRAQQGTGQLMAGCPVFNSG